MSAAALALGLQLLAGALPASDALRRADQALGQGQFERALAALADVDPHSPPALLVKVHLLRAEAYLALGRREALSAALLDALRVDPEAALDPKTAGPELTAAFLAVRAAATGTLRLAADVPGAVALVDGAQLGRLPLEVVLPVGRHKVRAVADGGRAVDLDAVVRLSQTSEVTARFAAPQPVPAAAVQAPPPAPRPGSRALPAALLVSGAAAAVAGAVVAAVGLSYNAADHRELTMGVALERRRAAEVERTVGLAVGGAGVVAAGLGASLLIWGRF